MVGEADYDAGYAVGWEAFGDKTVDQVEALLKEQSAVWAAGFTAGWFARREEAEHLYGADLLGTKLVPGSDWP